MAISERLKKFDFVLRTQFTPTSAGGVDGRLDRRAGGDAIVRSLLGNSFAIVIEKREVEIREEKRFARPALRDNLEL